MSAGFLLIAEDHIKPIDLVDNFMIFKILIRFKGPE